MDTYVIGDLQGCGQPFGSLLQQIEAISPQCRLIFAGDLVNRGPLSLATLRRVRDLGDRAESVLGNHDLHLLAAANGIRALHPSDTLQEILDAPDRDELLDWLRHRPLALMEQGHLIVHAGVLPQWSTEQVLSLAGEVEAKLRSDDWVDFLQHMYGNKPDHWDKKLEGNERLRCIVNALTRIRFCKKDGTMDFKAKENATQAQSDLLPWFDLPRRKTADTTIIFGHWSTLGLTMRDNLISLDTGCVWGGSLTAVRLSDRAIVQVPCPQAQRPEH